MLLTILADRDHQIRASGVFGLPSCLQGHACAREPVLKRHGLREHTLDIGDLRQSVAAPRIQRKAIEVEANDSVASPLPPKSERLIEEVSFDGAQREMDRGRDHFHLTAQRPYSIGESANANVAPAPLPNI